MKKTILETNESNLEFYLGKKIVIYCCRYIYAGTLINIDDFSIKLTDAGIVYETGEHNAKNWERFEPIKKDHCVALQSIESFGEFK
jgi:hypothetical protein